MTLVLAYKNLSVSRNISILDGDGVTITPAAGDKVRVRIGRVGETEKFLVTSGTNTTNGSSITTGSSNQLYIDGGDLNFDPGVYTFFVEFFDASEGVSGEWKNVDREVFVLEE